MTKTKSRFGLAIAGILLAGTAVLAGCEAPPEPQVTRTSSTETTTTTPRPVVTTSTTTTEQVQQH